MTGKLLMTEITIDLSDESMANIHAVQLKLRGMWRASPGMADHVVTQAEAVRHALVVATTGDWRIADLMPGSEGLTQ